MTSLPAPSLPRRGLRTAIWRSVRVREQLLTAEPDMEEGTALVPLERVSTEVALPEKLVERAQDYMEKASSERTRLAYAHWQRIFTSWCARHGCSALPASPETVAAWITDLADNGAGHRVVMRGRGDAKKPVTTR